MGIPADISVTEPLLADWLGMQELLIIYLLTMVMSCSCPLDMIMVMIIAVHYNKCQSVSVNTLAMVDTEIGIKVYVCSN